ncbi:MAG: hypothetical protein M1824_001966 [Vezdaea acicularis]|nr:MAG: hypothetical protein M1824_001966 [Vezdaea acicularis]
MAPYGDSPLMNIRRNAHDALSTLRYSPLAEVSGSLGDLGTLLPLLIALTLTDSISLSSTLVFTGLSNILTGLFFGIPLPVQPMKAIAALAIANNYTRASTASAGLFVAGSVGILSLTGLLSTFSKAVPVPVVKGIQLGAGLSLILSAGSSLFTQLTWTTPSWADNHFWTLFAAFFLLLSTILPHIPYALSIFALGLLFSLLLLPLPLYPHPQTWHPQPHLPTPSTFYHASLEAGLAQLPLTLLNSIIAVAHLSQDLFPTRPLSETHIGLSIAAMNLLGCFFSAMPTCHGSGGLAAQYRFGARSGASVILLGAFKLFLGLLFGDSLVHLLRRFPKGLLGVMVVAAGLELAKVGESLNLGARDLWAHEGDAERVLTDDDRKRRWSVMLVTVGGLLAFRNDAVGFAAGMALHWAYLLQDGKLRHKGFWGARWRFGRGGGETEPLLN